MQRSESRIIRPFMSVDEALANVSLRLLQDTDFSVDTYFTVDLADLPNLAPEFRLDSVDINFIEHTYQDIIMDLDLVITITQRALRRSVVIFSRNVRAVPEVWRVPSPIVDMFDWSGTLELMVYIVLARNLGDSLIGRPFRKGHWVAQKRFTVGPELSRRSFPIERWEPSRFEQRGLPRDSTYYIEVLDPELLNDIDVDITDVVRVGLHSSVFDRLSALGSSPDAQAIMSVINAEIVTEIVCRALQSAAESLDRQDSYVRRLLTRVAGNSLTVETLADRVRKGDYASVRALFQERIRLNHQLRRLSG